MKAPFTQVLQEITVWLAASQALMQPALPGQANPSSQGIVGKTTVVGFGTPGELALALGVTGFPDDGNPWISGPFAPPLSGPGL